MSALNEQNSRPGFFGAIAALALTLMVVIPLVEIAARPVMGYGVDNASVVVQHLGLMMAMAGAVAAARRNELSTLLHLPRQAIAGPEGRIDVLGCVRVLALAGSAVASAVLARASWNFVLAEMGSGTRLAYAIPVWWIQLALPIGFALIAWYLGQRLVHGRTMSWLIAGC